MEWEDVRPEGLLEGAFAEGTEGGVKYRYKRRKDRSPSSSPLKTDQYGTREKLFGVSAEFWLNLQRTYDLYEAKQGEAGKKNENIRPIT